jgi:hypothetical protein
MKRESKPKSMNFDRGDILGYAARVCYESGAGRPAPGTNKMEGNMKITDYIVVEVFLVAIWIDNAHAYIDPGAGSMVLQALLAALIGAGIFIRQSRMAVVSFFRRIKNKISGKNGDE